MLKALPNRPERDTTQHMYISTTQRPHARVHSSMAHPPSVHNQAQQNEYKYFTSLVYKWKWPSRWSAHMALQRDLKVTQYMTLHNWDTYTQIITYYNSWRLKLQIHLYHFIKSHNGIQGSSPPIVANTFTPGGKDIHGGVELPHAQCIICKPKNKAIAHRNISNSS